MKKTTTCIEISGLNKTYRITNKGLSLTSRIADLFTNKHLTTVRALSDVNLKVAQGDFLGIVGKNGSGKSTLLKLILGSQEPDPGSKIYTKGKIIRLSHGMSFDAKLSARDNLYVNGTIYGINFKQLGEKFDEIIDFAEINKFVDIPVKYFSSGMKSRLAFALALHVEADIFLIDEFFADVADAAFMEKAMQAFKDRIMRNTTFIHVSHSLDLLKMHCRRILVLNNGKGEIYDNVDEGFAAYHRSQLNKQ